MTEYSATKAHLPTKTIPWGVLAVKSTYPISHSLAAGDQITMLRLPKGATLTGVSCAIDPIDKAATPTVQLRLALAASGQDVIRDIIASEVTQLYRLNQAASLGYAVTQDDALLIVVETAPAEIQPGNITVIAHYTMDS